MVRGIGQRLREPCRRTTQRRGDAMPVGIDHNVPDIGVARGHRGGVVRLIDHPARRIDMRPPWYRPRGDGNHRAVVRHLSRRHVGHGHAVQPGRQMRRDPRFAADPVCDRTGQCAAGLFDQVFARPAKAGAGRWLPPDGPCRSPAIQPHALARLDLFDPREPAVRTGPRAGPVPVDSGAFGAAQWVGERTESGRVAIRDEAERTKAQRIAHQPQPAILPVEHRKAIVADQRQRCILAPLSPCPADQRCVGEGSVRDAEFAA